MNKNDKRYTIFRQLHAISFPNWFVYEKNRLSVASKGFLFQGTGSVKVLVKLRRDDNVVRLGDEKKWVHVYKCVRSDVGENIGPTGARRRHSRCHRVVHPRFARALGGGVRRARTVCFVDIEGYAIAGSKTLNTNRTTQKGSNTFMLPGSGNLIPDVPSHFLVYPSLSRDSLEEKGLCRVCQRQYVRSVRYSFTKTWDIPPTGEISFLGEC